MDWKKVRWIAAAAALLSFAVAVAAGYDDWLLAPALLLLATAFLLWRWSERSRQRDQEIAALSDRQAELIRTVNHLRHDWMNDLQVLFGYIQLNRQEKLKAYIEKLSDKLYRESLVSKLGDAELIAYLIAFRSNNHPFVLSIQPERDVNLALFGETGQAAAKMMMAVVEAYRLAADSAHGEENELSITIDLFGEQLQNREDLVLAIDCEYSGRYRKGQLTGLLQEIEALVRERDRGTISCDLDDRSADIEIRLQLTGWVR